MSELEQIPRLSHWLSLFVDALQFLSRSLSEIIEMRDAAGKNVFGQTSRAFDVEVERRLVEFLRSRGCSSLIVGEERGAYGGDRARGIVVIDPIDGSRNLLFGVPLWTITLAFSSGESFTDVTDAIIWAPELSLCFVASRGRGAYLVRRDGVYRLPLSQPSDEEPIVEAVFSRGTIERAQFLRKFGVLRHIGCISLALAYVASGAFVLSADLGGAIRPIDLVAGSLLVVEAGGYFATIPEVGILERRRVSYVATLRRDIFNEIISLLGAR